MAFDHPIVEQMIQDVGPAAFCRLAGLFIEETASELAAIETLAGSMPAGAPEYRELGRRAHSLKNAAGSFGLVGLALAARRLEQACDHAVQSAVLPTAADLRPKWDAEMPELLELVSRTAAGPNGQD